MTVTIANLVFSCRNSLPIWRMLSAFASANPVWCQTNATSVSPLRTYIKSKDTGLSQLLVVQQRRGAMDELEEALRLAETYSGSTCPYVLVGKSRLSKPNPGTLLGKGSVELIRQHLHVQPAKQVFINSLLTPVQERNLQAALGTPVLDRVAMIIAIFAQRAHTREAKMQVELASQQHQLTRLVRVMTPSGRGGFGEGGMSQVVSARQRAAPKAAGMGGGGGAGESELRLQRSRITARVTELRRELATVRRTRQLQRDGRRASHVPTVAVVGYTNAGKSSLLSRLAKVELAVEDKLFATLDPMLRRVHLPSGRHCVMSDTVGFIRSLPVNLVDAFRSTLEEAASADVLVHVLDASSPQVETQRRTVLQVLRSLGVSEERLRHRIIEFWNKADALLPRPSAEGLAHLRAALLAPAPAAPPAFAAHPAGDATQQPTSPPSESTARSSQLWESIADAEPRQHRLHPHTRSSGPRRRLGRAAVIRRRPHHGFGNGPWRHLALKSPHRCRVSARTACWDVRVRRAAQLPQAKGSVHTAIGVARHRHRRLRLPRPGGHRRMGALQALACATPEQSSPQLPRLRKLLDDGGGNPRPTVVLGSVHMGRGLQELKEQLDLLLPSQEHRQPSAQAACDTGNGGDRR